MKREALLEYLAKKDIEFSFDYDPYGESLFICSNEYFKDFLQEEMLDYVMATGDPIGGDFIASRKNEDIIITSRDNIDVNWDHSPVEDVAISKESLEEINHAFYNAFANKADDYNQWFLMLEVSKNRCDYNLKATIYYPSGSEKKLQKGDIPTEIVSKVINSIGGFNDDDSDDYGYDFNVEVSALDGIRGSFTEHFPLSFEI